MKPKILITNYVPDDHLEPLLGLAEIIKGPSGGPMCTREEVLALAPELVGIINQHELAVNRELLAAAPNLRIVANVAIGYNNLDIAALDEAGVWASNCPDPFSEPAADHTIALLLAVARRVPEADAYVRSGQWAKDGFQPGPWEMACFSAEKRLASSASAKSAGEWPSAPRLSACVSFSTTPADKMIPAIARSRPSSPNPMW
jgi:lactate dehydrogenase-like 2-hydroxyacid dehydrogenase